MGKQVDLSIVYLKKADLIGELEDILDEMIDSETPITINISNAPFGPSASILLINYKTNEVYDTTNQYTTSLYHTMTYTNDTISFKMPIELSFEDAALKVTIPVMGTTYTFYQYLYTLEDTDNDKIINVDREELPTSQPSE